MRQIARRVHLVVALLLLSAGGACAGAPDVPDVGVPFDVKAFEARRQVSPTADIPSD
jgi:hypothetical protein